MNREAYMNDVPEQNTLPTRIAVVTSAGGSEHAVSLRSADSVSAALRESFDAVQIFPFDADLEKSLLAWQPDVVFPVAHGAGGESGELQTLLDSLGLVYVGSGAASSALCWDKAEANKQVTEWLASAPVLSTDFSCCAVPPFITLQRGEELRAAILNFCDRLKSGAVVIKPAREGSSCGVSFCTSPHYALATKSEVVMGINGPIWQARLDSIVDCVEQTFAFDRVVIVQEAVVGTEITVGVLEDPDARALPVVEIVTPKGTWYDYQHKYSTGGSEHVIPARLPDPLLKLAQQVAVSVHRHLGCRHYSRVDFIVSNPDANAETPRLWFLEINTLPGFTATSLYPDAAKAALVALPELVRNLVLSAWSAGPNAKSAQKGSGEGPECRM